ncbi:hypothetical protein [Burkholderia vietnamiensis]|uniref:hypothetical protein n=1 Tax=Burkholderia vietnamiensis TaxID=60552 RepID=UPI0007556798|nr:hypothetical protein [Burkholderia vietnamiensis]KVE91299.1 N-terminal cleavage protein [Burkholderia vietnamiensis]HDR9155173.1 hypothetical protein [Burkholderia vietnamiensis]
MKRARRRTHGTSLLEAVLAVALLAAVMLTVVGSQFAMTRMQRATIWRERALWLADARIERRHAAPGDDGGLAALAAASLPDGAMMLDRGVAGVSYAIVGWRDADAAQSASASARCDAALTMTKPPSCVRIPFREFDADER